MHACDKCETKTEALTSVGPFRVCAECLAAQPAVFDKIRSLYD